MPSPLFSKTNLIWLFLLFATAVTFWVGESGMSNESGTWAVVLIFAMAFVKGLLIVYEYMEVRDAPLKWKIGLVGWLVFVISLILLAYWLGKR